MRIQHRLKHNNLRFHGSKVPSASAAHGAVSDLILSLQLDGVAPTFKLDKALSFSDMFKKLEELGLVQPSATPKKRNADSVCKVAQPHKEKVIFLKKIFLLIIFIPG